MQSETMRKEVMLRNFQGWVGPKRKGKKFRIATREWFEGILDVCMKVYR
jgi:hypothetical protein